MTYSVDLKPFQLLLDDQNSSLVVAMQLYALVLARLLNEDTVAFDLLFQNRTYQNKKFNDVIGMAVDGIPLVVSTKDEDANNIAKVLAERLKYINEYNINFFNLISGIKSFFRWGKVMKRVNDVTSSKMFASCLLNFAGNAEEEYERLWEYSVQGQEQTNLKYADFYVAVKTVNETMEFHILCSFEQDMKKVERIFKEELDGLINRRTINKVKEVE